MHRIHLHPWDSLPPHGARARPRSPRAGGPPGSDQPPTGRTQRLDRPCTIRTPPARGDPDAPSAETVFARIRYAAAAARSPRLVEDLRNPVLYACNTLREMRPSLPRRETSRPRTFPLEICLEANWN